MLPTMNVTSSADRSPSADRASSAREQQQQPALLTSWTARFLRKPENSFMCAVDESYVLDRFNLFGLENVMPGGLNAAVRHVLGDARTDGGAGRVGREAAAELFYGLVHARYVLTPEGVAKMLEKYSAGRFGRCPRVNCDRWPVLPIGLSDVVKKDTVKVYCPRCMDVYTPEAGLKGASADGAFFGTGFPHMAFMTRPECRPARPRGRFAAKLHGFTVHESAAELQRLAAVEYKNQLNRTDETNDTPSRSKPQRTADPRRRHKRT